MDAGELNLEVDLGNRVGKSLGPKLRLPRIYTHFDQSESCMERRGNSPESPNSPNSPNSPDSPDSPNLVRGAPL